eukprot:COSAG06_NODE_176_length_21031_cov_66.751290_10_plen_364_part_00
MDLPRQQSIAPELRDARNEQTTQLRRIQKRQAFQRRASQKVLDDDDDDPAISPGGRSNQGVHFSPGSHGSSLGSPDGGFIPTIPAVPGLHPAALLSTASSAGTDGGDDEDPAAALTRGSLSSVSLASRGELVDQRLGAIEQISLISTLLVGTAAGALLVVDREKVGEYQCGVDIGGGPGRTDGSGDSGQARCDSTEMPRVVWMAVLPLHLTIGLNLFVTLVTVLVAFNTKRKLGWGEGFTIEASVFFEETKVLRWAKAVLFWSHLYIKSNILLRQAQDKHRESTQKEAGFSQGLCADGIYPRAAMLPSGARCDFPHSAADGCRNFVPARRVLHAFDLERCVFDLLPVLDGHASPRERKQALGG